MASHKSDEILQRVCPRIQGPYLLVTLKNTICLFFLQDFEHLKATQLLHDRTVWFSQSEILFLSNASKFIKIWRRKL